MQDLGAPSEKRHLYMITGIETIIDSQVKHPTSRNVIPYGSSEFVFAFSIRQLTVYRCREMSAEDYAQGALSDAVVDAVQGISNEYISFLEKADYPASGIGYEANLVMDGDDELPSVCIAL